MKRLAAALSLVILCACSGSSDGVAASSSPSGNVTLTVLAGSSLTKSFIEIGQAFEAAHPGVNVHFVFGPSNDLAQQIDQGTPADVFASADTESMSDVVQNGPGVTDRTTFAHNRLAVVVPRDNPADIRSINDLADPAVRLVVAAQGIPGGDYARKALAQAGIADRAEANIVFNETSGEAILQRIVRDEADAGIVFVTDVSPEVASKIKMIPIPDNVNVIATYEIGVVAGSEHADLAGEFVSFVTGPEGQAVLRSYGYLPSSG